MRAHARQLPDNLSDNSSMPVPDLLRIEGRDVDSFLPFLPRLREKFVSEERIRFRPRGSLLNHLLCAGVLHLVHDVLRRCQRDHDGGWTIQSDAGVDTA